MQRDQVVRPGNGGAGGHRPGQHLPRRDHGRVDPDQLLFPGLLNLQFPGGNLGGLGQRHVVEQDRLAQDLVEQAVRHRRARVVVRLDVGDRRRAQPGDVVDLLPAEVRVGGQRIGLGQRAVGDRRRGDREVQRDQAGVDDPGVPRRVAGRVELRPPGRQVQLPPLRSPV